jgi:hypothetical protein
LRRVDLPAPEGPEMTIGRLVRSREGGGVSMRVVSMKV